MAPPGMSASSTPQPGAEPTEQAALVRQLREQLAAAVADENFELAAEVRDQLRGLE